MNKGLVWVVGIISVLFVGLLVIGTFAQKGYEKDVKAIQERQEGAKEVEGLEKTNTIYGKGGGAEITLEDGVTMWVYRIVPGRDETLAGVDIAIKNTTGQDYGLSKRKIYLEDGKGEQYPVYDLGKEEAHATHEAPKYDIVEFQEVFTIPNGYSGDYSGWVLAIEGDSGVITAPVTIQ